MGFHPFVQFVRGIQGKLQTNMFGGMNGQNPQQMAFIRQMQRELENTDSMAIPFGNLNVAVFDIETTGFYPYKGDQIISIGAVKIIKGKVSEDSFYSLVRFEKPLSNEIKELTGLSEAVLEKAPPLSEVLISFLEFVKDMPLVAHHANHEKSFMQHSCWKLFRTPFKYRILDTSFLYRIADPNKSFWRLEDLCEFYSIPVKDRHHALGDAKLTALLWCRLIEEVHKLGCSNLKEVYERIARFN
ncbi:DNA polymerase-3 subunit epsilon [Cytobacillus firmus]|uniref:DNA polymerase-3 subunit epsilon n=2 Tax=Cytobacillus TaxID=2675230 RepID=A0A366JT39_CYTFI|nr:MULTISPECIES: exonuclease domain-containing protein [Cytobacillus]RBP92137.1 DNA polymerase-3 subunit epsilon [Cytobacillus firmus]TDX42178.1 DNA polymerase-3 subunit epsilon [Cytobacillus oceanisediminis]